jgi:Family of unknown function (DUF5713)
MAEKPLLCTSVSGRITMPSLEKLKEHHAFSSWEGTWSSDIVDPCRAILHTTIDELSQLPADATAEAKKKVITSAVIKFNDLNDAHDEFIETIEREDIAEELLQIAEAAGLKPDDDLLVARNW